MCKLACFIELDHLSDDPIPYKINDSPCFVDDILLHPIQDMLWQLPIQLIDATLKLLIFMIHFQQHSHSIRLLLNEQGNYLLIQNNLNLLVCHMLLAETCLLPLLDISAVATTSVDLEAFELMADVFVELEALRTQD